MKHWKQILAGTLSASMCLAFGSFYTVTAEEIMVADTLAAEQTVAADTSATEQTTPEATVGDLIFSSESTPVSDYSVYGNDAYSYLEEFVTNFPERTNEENNRSEAVNSAGAWIQTKLEEIGYSVNVQEYVHENFTGINYAVTKEGNSDRIICIGAHYDSGFDADGNATGGVDDNASGVATLLSLAKELYDQDTPCTLQFIFFDNEELGGYVGSYQYIENVLQVPLSGDEVSSVSETEESETSESESDESEAQTDNTLLDRIICYINLDSIGAGDQLFVYGGEYQDDGSLTQIWPYRLVHTIANSMDISLGTIPSGAKDFEDPPREFIPPTRIFGSDHHYFIVNGIPYLYFESALWADADGNGGSEDTHLTCHYQTADTAFVSTGGQIMHTQFDNLEAINTAFPGRLQNNMGTVSRLVFGLLTTITEDTPAQYAEDDEVYAASLAAELLGNEIEEISTESFTEEETEEETESFTESFSEEETSEESMEIKEGSPLPLLIFFIAIALIVIVIIAVVIHASSVDSRRRRRKRRNYR